MHPAQTELHLCICIPTFKRRENLRELLLSLEAQELGPQRHVRWEVALIDNDPEGSARPVYEEFKTRRKLALRYEQEKRSGLSYVRNKAIEVALDADFMGMLDDDQTVAPVWLEEMLRVQQLTGAGCVSGQVISKLPLQTPVWVLMGHFFDKGKLTDGQVLALASTANLFLSCEFLRQTGLRFDHRFRHTGGEDTFFFTQAVGDYRLKIVGSEKAIAYEAVFANRIRVPWLLKRAFRAGGTLAQCDMLYQFSRKRSLIRAIKGVAAILRGIAMLPCGVAGRHIAVKGLTYICLGFGELAGIFGYVFKEYGALHEPKDSARL